MTGPELDEYVAQLVDTAPPLTEDQKSQLRVLLAPQPGHATSAAATAAPVITADSSPAGKLVGGRRGSA